MKRTLLIIGFLVLTGCSARAEHNLPLYETNKAKFIIIKTELRDCMQRAVDTDYYGLERTRHEVQACDQTAFNHLRFKMNPETFYVYGATLQENDPYDGFSFCSSSIANGMWDFPPEETSFSFRNVIRDCLNNFPGATHQAHTPERLLKKGDHFRVLLGAKPFICYWNPTAIGYAEDADCSPQN